MDPRKLEHFLTVAETGNFTRAAKLLRIAQPSLSQSIRALERELKVALFHRLPTGLELTEAGRQLLAPASRALRALKDARESLENLVEVRSGRVDIVAPSSLITYPTAELVRDFTRQYPGVQIAIAEASDSQQAGEWVESGRAEVAVFELSQRTPALTRERLLSYELYAVFPEGNGTSDVDEAGDIAWEALTGRPLIALGPHTVSRRILESHGLGEQVSIQVGHAETAVELVRQGAGPAILVEPYALLALGAGATIGRLVPSTAHAVGLGWRGGEAAPAAQAFIDVALGRSSRPAARQ